MDYARIARALWGTGLIARGGFHANAEDGVPGPAGAGGTVIIVGNAGAALWRVFAAAPEFAFAKAPLDTWTARVLDAVADELGASTVYPFGGPPHRSYRNSLNEKPRTTS